MTRSRQALVIAIAWLVYGLSMGLHEPGHAMTGLLVGGTPTFISSTDVRGDWSTVSVVGMTTIGTAGSLINLALAAAGFVALCSGTRRSFAFGLFAWLLMGVNGFVVGMYLMASPLFDFGDWATVLRQYGGHSGMRMLLVAVGGALTAGWFRLTSRLSTVVDTRGLTLSAEDVRASWAAGGVLAAAAAVFSPLGLAWAVPVALGSTMGTTWPMLGTVARRSGTAVARSDSVDESEGNGWWILAGLIVAVAFVVVLGPGVEL